VIPKNVLDYAKVVTQLRKDTGLELLSYNWSEAMLQTENGCLYFLIWDKENEEYIAKPEARQDKNCEEINSNKAVNKSLKSICCECGCEVDLKEVCLTEDTGEPICNSCKN